MADETKFTMGPWTADGINVFSHGSCLAICDDEVFSQQEYEANATLIAAAPELYDVLSGARQYVVLAVLDGRDNKLSTNKESNAALLKHAERDLATIDAALAKARGEPTPHP